MMTPLSDKEVLKKSIDILRKIATYKLEYRHRYQARYMYHFVDEIEYSYLLISMEKNLLGQRLLRVSPDRELVYAKVTIKVIYEDQV